MAFQSTANNVKEKYGSGAMKVYNTGISPRLGFEQNFLEKIVLRMSADRCDRRVGGEGGGRMVF